MSQPFPPQPDFNSMQSIQNFIKYHQASAQLGLALLARNQAATPFLQNQQNPMFNMGSNGVPMMPPAYQNFMKTPFSQTPYEPKVQQTPEPLPFPTQYENVKPIIETSPKTELKMEDSHHSDVTKDSDSVKKEDEKEDEELDKPFIEEKFSSPTILIKSKKITKAPKAPKVSKAPKAQKAPKVSKKAPSIKLKKEESVEEHLSASEENEPSDNGKSSEPKWRRKCWSNAEDQLLLELIETQGKRWSKIANVIGGRTGKQVRDRYLNVLMPNIKRTNWTENEDKLIWTLHDQMGTKWCKIAEYLPGRTEGQVKNRFYTYLKKKSEKEEQEMKADLTIKPNMENLIEEAKKRQNIKQEEIPDKNFNGILRTKVEA